MPGATKDPLRGSPNAVEVILGRVGRARGLGGELYIDLATDAPDTRFRVGAVCRAVTGIVADKGESVGEALTVAAFHGDGARGLVRFAEVTTREAAAALTGRTLVATVSASESTADEAEFFDHQLVGLRVVGTDGSDVGRVVRLEHQGFQDALVVAGEGTGHVQRAIPFVGALVPTVDLTAGLVVVDPIPGLLTDDDGDQVLADAVGRSGTSYSPVMPAGPVTTAGAGEEAGRS